MKESGTVSDTLWRAVYRVVLWALRRDVDVAVDRAVYRAVHGTIDVDINETASIVMDGAAAEDSPHVALADFLSTADRNAP